ncbi:hypothetical protein [Actinoplanes sp. NPDC051851]|uniref:hypothetical protein n=1 Tax=Actinoplanes sp. NPDC051851 TaxID=3154753 RepID=UPI0034379F44
MFLRHPGHPDLDPAVAYPKAAHLRTALTGRDWAAGRELLDDAEPVERTSLIQICGRTPEIADLLRGVLRENPADGAAGALLGTHLTAAAWAPRRRGRVRDLAAGLREAERVLIDAAARTPADPAVWTARLTTARGLELGQSEARRRYDRVAAVDPHHLPAQRRMLRQLCPKWGGSWAAAEAFAHEASAAAPAGSLSPVLIVDVHLERWLTEKAHLRADAVRTEVYDAARRSVWHSDFRPTHGWVEVMNAFAVAFGLLDDQPAAATLFTVLGELATESPWIYLGDPAGTFVKYRDRALSSVGGAR